MAFLDFLFGSKGKTQQLPTLNPQQQQVLNSILSALRPEQFNLSESPLYQQGSSYLQNLLSGSPEAFEAFENPLKTQYYKETVPALAERFSSLGAQKSSAFNQALAKSGQDLSERLANLRSGLQLQAVPQALGYAQAPGQMGLNLAQLGLGTSPFGYGMSQPSTGFLGNLLSGLGGGFAQKFGYGMGGLF